MNLPQFIAKRIRHGESGGWMSRPIVRIATAGIAIGVALMLLSLSIVKGFQKEIRNKVTGFGSHFQVIANERSYSRDSRPLLFDKEVYDELKATPHVRHVQVFATKPGLLETRDALQGVIIKGVRQDFDWTFIKSCMKEGRVPAPDSAHTIYEICISSYIAKRMMLKVGQRVSLYLFNEMADPRQRNFTITGIYETGLEDFDAQFVFIDLAHVQRLSGWGLRLEAQVDSNCFADVIPMGAYAFGGDGLYHFQWSVPEWRGEGPHGLFTTRDTTVRVIVNDGSNTQPDTAWLTIDFEDDNAMDICRPYTTTVRTAGRSEDQYIGGYEVLIDDYEFLLEADDQIFSSLASKFLQTQKITDRNPEIFSWLEMLDINVYIIIILMVVISIVNMTSALLIIIMERQSMIGTLKALGIQNRSVMSIFIRNAVVIIGKGMLFGNIIGIGFALLQSKFHLISLNPESYYVSAVPISFDWWLIIALNICTLLICSVSMLLPAMLVLNINPIKAMRFS